MMNKRGTGALFCLIGAMLISARYITAAVYLSGSVSWDAELFHSALVYEGNTLFVLSVISFVIGVVYLIVSEIEEHKEEKK